MSFIPGSVQYLPPPIVYFLVPADLNVLGLALAKELPVRAYPLRSVGAIAWALILPGMIFVALLFGLLGLCAIGAHAC